MDPASPETPAADLAPPPPELPPYQGIALAHVHWIATAEDAAAARSALLGADVLGFDTESKPTFAKGEVSTGPHLIQLATETEAWLFPVDHCPDTALVREVLEAERILKVGFGLGDDVRRLKSKLGIHPAGVLDLSSALREGARNELGAKTAVAKFFGRRLQKSKKTSTTNWSRAQLTDKQKLYAADDAQVAVRVYREWKRRTAEGTAGGGAPEDAVQG